MLSDMKNFRLWIHLIVVVSNFAVYTCTDSFVYLNKDSILALIALNCFF